MIKCPHCGREFDEGGPAQAKWYHNIVWVIIALACLGPFALRIVWSNPRYKPMTKWIITIVVVIVTVLATMQLFYSVRATTRQFQELGF